MAGWIDRDDHLARHKVTVEQAEEALNNANRIVFNPDLAAKSGGRGVRTVGYSRSAGAILCVITVTDRGITYGATAFRASTIYRRIYREEGSND